MLVVMRMCDAGRAYAVVVLRHSRTDQNAAVVSHSFSRVSGLVSTCSGVEVRIE